MSIKPDRWIAKMAKEHGMIEPFEEGQVRDGVISYGLSSYGYDLRVSDEFKIFTNVFTATVDPKEFDPRSFVDHQGDICVVPPNSFALARSVEYFRIPRNVLTICLGKSTYARCFRGDTRVALVDGSAPTLEEMAERAEEGEMFWGYAMGRYGRIQVALLEAPRYIGRDALLEIELDNGRKVRCTPDHEFLRRDGRRAQADDLRPGDSLMPLYRSDTGGYESIYQPSTGELEPIGRMVEAWISRNARANEPPEWESHSSSREDPSCRSPERLDVQPVNHKIQSIRPLPGDHDVYCLTVPEAGNFALDAGVFVGNCGIIVNVTPFEPEWEGHVTLEISNTTPLPAKIYANEGLAQVLFFESDEECETSYRDRGGKYQSQRGVTLPKL